MFEIQSISKSVLIANFDTIHLFTSLDKDSQIESYKYKHSQELTSITLLPNKQLLAFTDLSKKFYLINYKSNNDIITTKTFQKRAAKLLINRNESVVLLGDKTGDVYSLNLNELENAEFKLVMGHLSMLTDMKLSNDEKFILTSDRDEKIRISHYPNSYNIEGYLLAHKDFVMQFEFVNESRLISISGDSKLILWDLNTLKAKQIIDVKSYIKEESQFNGIYKFDFNPDSNQIYVHLFKSNFLLEFNLGLKEINYVRKISLNFDDFIRIHSNYYLFTAFNHTRIFVIKKLVNNEFLDLDQDDLKMQSLVDLLNTDVNIENPNNVKIEIEKNYQSYFKAIVNNMDDYYQRKQERISATSGKRKHTTSKSESDIAEAKLTIQ